MSDKKNKNYRIVGKSVLTPYKSGEIAIELPMQKIVFMTKLSFMNSLGLMACYHDIYYMFVEPKSKKAIVSSQKSFMDTYNMMERIIIKNQYGLAHIQTEITKHS